MPLVALAHILRLHVVRAVADRQLQGVHARAAGGVRVSIRVFAAGRVSRAVPLVLLALVSLEHVVSAVADREFQGHHAIAAVHSSKCLLVLAALRISLLVPRVAVTGSLLYLFGHRMLHPHIHRVTHRTAQRVRGRHHITGVRTGCDRQFAVLRIIMCGGSGIRRDGIAGSVRPRDDTWGDIVPNHHMIQIKSLLRIAVLSPLAVILYLINRLDRNSGIGRGGIKMENVVRVMVVLSARLKTRHRYRIRLGSIVHQHHNPCRYH